MPLRDVAATGTYAVTTRCCDLRIFAHRFHTRGWRTSTRSLLMTWWRSPQSEISAWAIAAPGSASTAPTAPSTAAPPSAAPNASAGCSSIVRAVMRGENR